MAERRPSKDSDQFNTQAAYEILEAAMAAHPEIEPTIWYGACWSLMINGCLRSGLTYEEFCIDFNAAKEHYKKRWDNDN
jgi:hypothetical protein